MGPRASELIAHALPRGTTTLKVLPGRGHWIHVEAADAVLDAIDEWLPKAPRAREGQAEEGGEGEA